MRRLLCKILGHTNETRVVDWIGGQYRRNWSFCDRCSTWRVVSGD